jgi:hypothetical protein
MSGILIQEQIVKVLRGHPIPEGWQFSRFIYETTDLYGTWDVMLVHRATPSEDTAQDHNYYRDADGHVIGPDVFIDGKPYGGTPLPGTPSEDTE